MCQLSDSINWMELFSQPMSGENLDKASTKPAAKVAGIKEINESSIGFVLLKKERERMILNEIIYTESKAESMLEKATKREK